MSKLLDYLNILDKDAAVREAHLQDPIATMKGFGLSDVEQSAILSGSREMLAAAIGISADALPAIILPNTTFDDRHSSAWESAAYLNQVTKNQTLSARM